MVSNNGRDTNSPGLTRRQFLIGAGAGSAMIAMASAGAWTPAFAKGTSIASSPKLSNIPTSDDLRETGDLQRRWLSLPESRIVINPFDFNTSLTPTQYNNGSEMPLHAGYYAGDQAFSLRQVISLYRKPRGRTGGFSVAWEDDFSTLSSAWTGDSWVSRQIVNGQLKLTIEPGGQPWGVTYQWVEIDLDKYPYLQIDVTQAEAAWSLKVNDGTQTVDIALQGDTHQEGTFTYNIAQSTGWSGSKRFQVRVFAIGTEQSVYVNDIRIMGVNTVLEGATSYDTAWLPYELPFSATYDNGTTISGCDYFYDVNTLTRTIGFRLADASDSQWTLSGHYNGDVSWNQARQVLTVATDTYAYAVVFNGSVDGSLTYYPSMLELLSDTGGSSKPATDGYWAAQIQLAANRALTASIGFATVQEGTSMAVQRATAPLSGNKADARRSQQREFWDKVLADLPHPTSFGLTNVPNYGVAARDVRHEYYAAWVFAVANSLPVMPETGYMYPQIPAGKPSMWIYGAPGSKPSAAWESFLGQQFYAFYDPGTAWAAYKGLMSLVGSDGELGGESLPSRKAQTAMVLYQLTGDKNSLSEVYPALKRHLLWENDHLYWIPPGATGNPDSRDAEFVVSLLLDMTYAQDIATTLGMSGDASMWESKQTALLPKYQDWFWETPTSEPMQYYNVKTGERNPGNTVWVTTGLHVGLLQEGPYTDGLTQRFLSDYDPEGTFNGFAFPKYPDTSYTLYGLLERGMLQEAEVFVNTALRDVTRANMFAEQYQNSGFPAPSGVRPSLFGNCMMIDFVWVKNGYRMDQGWPNFVRMTNDTGGVNSLGIRHKRLNVQLEPTAQAVDLSGSFVRESQSCRRLSAPLGETIPLARSCATGK